MEKTDDQRWPPLVNSDRNLSRLSWITWTRPSKPTTNCGTVDEHRFQDSDLYKIVLGATLNVNPFKKLTAGEIRRLCIENHERLEKIKDLFSTGDATEASEVLAPSQGARSSRPTSRGAGCWTTTRKRSCGPSCCRPSCTSTAWSTASCSPTSTWAWSGSRRSRRNPSKYTIKDMLKADPDQIADDVAAVEAFLKEEPEKRLAFLLADRLKLDHPDQARKVLLTEKLSSLVRSMALLSLLIDLLTNRKKEYHKAILDDLDEEGTKGKEDTLSIAARRPTPQWGTLLATYRRGDPVLRDRRQAEGPGPQAQGAEDRATSIRPVLPTLERRKGQSARLLHERSAAAHGSGRHLSGTQEPVLADADPATWHGSPTSSTRSIKAAEQDVDAANTKFQDLYHAHYVKWINQTDAPPIFTHQFVPRVLKTHWDSQSGQKAVILIFDGLRVDAWEELVRPVLEEKYDVLDQLPGSAILPSETHLSRKAISAGCLPVGFCSTTENALLENALKTHLGLTVKFKVEKQDEAVECGISARYTSDPIDVVIFNFTDKNLHNNNADLAFIYDTTVREILRQDVRSVLREMPNDATVFVISDHGFTPVPDRRSRCRIKCSPTAAT